MNCSICPLSKKELTDPVVAADGYTYERSAIEEYFNSGKTVSPITGEEITDKTLIPNKTLKSLILNKSLKKLEELSAKYMEMKAENIASVKPGSVAKDILANLQKVDSILKAYKEGKQTAEDSLKLLDPLVKLLPEDDELLQEYILLAYWTKNFALGQPCVEALNKSPLFDMIGPLLGVYAKSFADKAAAKSMYEEIQKSREANLFRVRDLKYKAIALGAIGMGEEAMTHFNAYEVFVPFDPSVYALYKARTLRDMGKMKELKNYQTDYFIKYGTFIELANIK